MDMNVRQEDDITIVCPNGRIDVNTRSEFLGSVVQIIDTGSKKLLLDLSKTDYMSSAGIRALLEIADHAKTNGGKFIICSPSDSICELFQIVHIETHIQVYPTEFDALNVLV